MLTSKLNPETEQDFAYSVNTNPYLHLHNHDHFEITIVTKGSVGHCINQARQTLSCSTVLYIRPKDIHSFYRIQSTDFEYINLAFPLETLQGLFAYIDNGFDALRYQEQPMPHVVQLTSSETETFRNRIEGFTRIAPDDIMRKKAFFRLILADLFYRYFQSPAEGKHPYPLWFRHLIQEMDDPGNFSQGVTRLEELSGKNPAYISRIFKEHFHQTPTDYINSLRLNYCANKLVHSDADILDIAMDAGFNSLSHFYHLFKKKYHTSPGCYRKDNMMLL